MSREIKFRGLNKYGHFVYGFLTTNSEFDSVIERFVDYGPAQQDPCGGVGWVIDIVDKKTVGQFIGLTDKNGVEVYEEDIVSGFNGELVGIISFSNEDCAFLVEMVGGGGALLNQLYMNNFEVIGSTHQKPELIKGLGVTND